VAKAYVAANPDLVVAPFVFPDESGGSAIAIKKGNSALLEAVNKSLARLGAANAVEGFVADANKLMEQL